LAMVGEDGYVITEAGFGSDMGGEKFFNIKCRYSGLAPSCAVIVCTVRAMKLHGGGPKVAAGQALDAAYTTERVDLVQEGCKNLGRHIQNMNLHGVPCVVAINKFAGDTDSEITAIREFAVGAGAVDAVTADHFGKGGAGAVALGEAVVAACAGGDTSEFHHLYPLEMGIVDKLNAIVTKVYGGAGISMPDEVAAKIARYEAQGLGNLPICMSKTQYSFSHDPDLKGAPTGFTVPMKDIYVSAGAGFLVASLGDISFMPGLPTKPSYYKIDLDLESGKIVGLS